MSKWAVSPPHSTTVTLKALSASPSKANLQTKQKSNAVVVSRTNGRTRPIWTGSIARTYVMSMLLDSTFSINQGFGVVPSDCYRKRLEIDKCGILIVAFLFKTRTAVRGACVILLTVNVCWPVVKSKTMDAKTVKKNGKNFILVFFLVCCLQPATEREL